MKKNKFDLILLIAVITLVIFGIIMIYSSSHIWALYKYGDSLKYVKAQIIFFIIGTIVMIILSKVPYKYYLDKANIILGVCFLLLVLVLIPGIGTIRNGSRSWFGIGSFGVQPSEFAKLGLIIFFSRYLSKNDRDLKKIIKGVLPILLIALFAFGLIMLQPDFGTGMVMVVSLISLLFVSGVAINFFISLGILGILGIVGLIISAPYRLQRIFSFINPWKDPLGSGFQIIQSLYAIGPGGLLGFGFGNSRQKHFYLPEPQTDFIFSIISEEFGFLGVLIIGTLFITILIRGIMISLKAKDLFSKYLAFGITFGIIFQAVLNLMVVIGLVPVTGITLPFLSYGGSSLLISMTSVGILLNISRYQK
ncbi:MAG: putative lipid II flippase FtsW [Bacilli bacterium]